MIKSLDEALNDLNDIIRDRIFIGSSVDDLKQEIQVNCWSISFTQEHCNQLSVADLLEFLQNLIVDRQAQICAAAMGHGMLFYLWFDEMACQLRFNLISDFHTQLPFGSEVNQLQSMEPIIGAFLSSPHHEGIPFSELEKADFEFDEHSLEAPIPQHNLDVYVTHLAVQSMTSG